jgi:hypothetical protein
MDRRSLCLLVAFAVSGCSDIPVNHDTEEACGCLSEQIRVSVDTPISSTMVIDPCRTFKLTIKAIADRPESVCTIPMICPASGIFVTGADVERAAQHPDVREALRAGISRYGFAPDKDSTKSLYRLGIGAVEFDVGAPCDGREECVPIPAGITALIDMLNKVSSQEVRRDPCRAPAR